MSARTHVAFLRAINVGDRRLTMDELARAVAHAGLVDVATWQAAGTLAFSADGRATVHALQGRIEDALGERLGFDVPTIVRTAAQVQAIVAYEPFTRQEVERTEGRLQVVLVRGEPDRQVVREVLGMATDDDHLRWHGHELYWLPRAGISSSSLDVMRLGERLGTTTVRTHRSIAGMAAKLL